MAADMVFPYGAHMVADMVEDMVFPYVERMVADMVEDMVFPYVERTVADIVEDMVFPYVADMEEDMVFPYVADMVEDMVFPFAAYIPVQNVAAVPAYISVLQADIQACKAHKLARKARNHCYSRSNKLSKLVLKHLKRSTRLKFPVVFSLKTPCVKVLFYTKLKISLIHYR